MMKVRDSGGASTDLKSDAPNEDGFNHLMAGKKCNMTNKMIAKTLMQFFIDGYDTAIRYVDENCSEARELLTASEDEG